MEPDQKKIEAKQPPAKKPFRISQRMAIVYVVILSAIFGGGGLAAKIISDRSVTPLQLQEAKRKVPIKKIDWEKALFSVSQIQDFQQTVDAPLEVETSTQGNPAPFERKKSSDK